MGGLAFAIGGFIFVIFGVAFVYASRVKKVGPNEVLIVSGRGETARVVVGGRVFVWPILERVDDLSLEIMTNMSLKHSS